MPEPPPALGVFASACPHPAYEPLAEDAGRQIAERGAELVFGGGTTGCMGAAARGAHAAGGHVVGITPLFLHDSAAPGTAWPEFVTPDMHSRKKRIYAPCVGFLALPGGPGTMDELFEAAVWSKHRIHRHHPAKPVVLVNWAGYWDGILQQLGRTVSERFLAQDTRAELFQVADTTSEALDKLGIPAAHHRRAATVTQTSAIKSVAAPHAKRKPSA